MLSVLMIVLPIFALIFAGWLVRRIGVLGPAASGELNRFVVHLAMPALLFDVVANAQWRAIWHPGFVAAFGLGAALIFATTVAIRVRRGNHLADAAVDGLNAGYANTAFIGFPLTAAALGPQALAYPLAASILTVCVLFGTGIVVIEIGLATERRPHRIFLKVAASLARNPLLIAPVAGALCLATGLTPPPPVETFLKLLGGAAAPCALVALGLFMAEKRAAAAGQAGTVTLLVVLKLLAQPLVTWLLATRVFHLPPEQTRAAVLLAALPTGTGPFMVAEFYRREAAITARVVLASTIVSVLSVTLYLAHSS